MLQAQLRLWYGCIMDKLPHLQCSSLDFCLPV